MESLYVSEWLIFCLCLSLFLFSAFCMLLVCMIVYPGLCSFHVIINQKPKSRVPLSKRNQYSLFLLSYGDLHNEWDKNKIKVCVHTCLYIYIQIYLSILHVCESICVHLYFSFRYCLYIVVIIIELKEVYIYVKNI